MNSNTSKLVIQLLAYGLILAAVKIVSIFFDSYNIIDFVLFLAAGIMFGGKIPPHKWAWGLLMSLPAFALCLLLVINLGYSSIINGIGTSFAVSLIVIPVATSIGILIRVKLALRRSIEKK